MLIGNKNMPKSPGSFPWVLGVSLPRLAKGSVLWINSELFLGIVVEQDLGRLLGYFFVPK